MGALAQAKQMGLARHIGVSNFTVALIEHIRGQEVFSGLDELITAMDRDSRKARDLIKAAKPLSALDVKLGFLGDISD